MLMIICPEGSITKQSCSKLRPCEGVLGRSCVEQHMRCARQPAGVLPTHLQPPRMPARQARSPPLRQHRRRQRLQKLRGIEHAAEVAAWRKVQPHRDRHLTPAGVLGSAYRG